MTTAAAALRIGIIIPDRNDRPILLHNCMRMLAAQTLQPEIINVVNYLPKSEKCDITERYRTGYDQLRGKNLDLIAFIENDDYYCANYLEFMAKQWILSEKPDILGLNHTIYYHIRTFEHFTMFHNTRSSAMNTVIKPDLDLKWGHDNDPYTDVWLWNLLKGIIITPEKEACLGIKHGIGLCGGQNHTDHMDRFINKDHDKAFLRSVMDLESFEFYSNYFPQAATH
jgi:hypothetical protein